MLHDSLETWFSVSGRHYRLGNMQGTFVALIKYDGGRLLRRRITRSYCPPEILNTDQGKQFTGSARIITLTEADVKISMDGRGRYLDNIFIERLWRSLTPEAVYLHELTDGFMAERFIRKWITFYNAD